MQYSKYIEQYATPVNNLLFWLPVEGFGPAFLAERTCFRMGVFSTVRTEAYHRYMPPVLPVPDTSVSSVQHQYRYRTLRYVRYDINTVTGHFGKFGTRSIPIPDSSISPVRHGYRYRRYRYRLSYWYRTLRPFRYNINTGTGYFGNFGTTSIPVPDTSVSSVLHPCGYREYRRYRIEHTLAFVAVNEKKKKKIDLKFAVF